MFNINFHTLHRRARRSAMTRTVVIAMLAGAVGLATGYAKLKGGGQPAERSAAFQPEPSAPESVPTQAEPTAVAKVAAKPVKTQVKKAEVVVITGNTASKVRPIASKPPAKTQPKAQPAATREPVRVAQAAVPRPAAADAGDWPEYRGKLRNGISTETGWAISNQTREVWKANVGFGFASIVISQGRAFTMGNDGGQDTVWCFDANTGKGIWRQSYPCDVMANMHEGGPAATPTVDGGLVFTYSKRGHLNAFDAATGKVAWRKDVVQELGAQIPQWGISSTPVVYGDSLFVMVGGQGATLAAFKKTTGELQWKVGNDKPAYAALQVFTWQNKQYLAAFHGGGVAFYNLADGKELWRYGWRTQYEVNAAMPLISGDKVFISSGYNTGCAMLQSSKDDSLLWQNRSMRNHFGSSVLLGGYIYGFDDSQLTCLEAATGKVMWTGGRLGKGNLIASDGKLILLSERGELVIAPATPERYQEISRNQILGGKCWTSPALANGKIYARNAAGDLVCVKF